MIKWFERKKSKRLIQKSVDNALSEQEKKELNRLFNKYPHLKQLHDSLYAIDQNLKDFACKEGDADVSDLVMKKVKESSSHSERNLYLKSSKTGILYSSFSRYAVAAAIGILIGIGSVILVSQSKNISTDHVYGTMMSGNEAQGITFSVKNNHIRMIPYLQKDLLYLNFFTDTKDVFDVTVNFNPQDYIPIAQQSGTTTRMTDIRFDTDRVAFACSGQTSAQIIIRKKTDNPSTPLIIKASSNGTEIFSKKISP